LQLSNNSEKQKVILKELAKYNKFARKFMKKRSFNYKAAYSRLVKTEDWKKGKALVIEYCSLSNNKFICPVCETEVNPYASTMHHNVYDNRKLFDPRNVSFLHYKCHDDHHQQWHDLAWTRKGHFRVRFFTRGFKIYFPKKTKIFVRYEYCTLLVVLVIFLIFTL